MYTSLVAQGKRGLAPLFLFHAITWELNRGGVGSDCGRTRTSTPLGLFTRTVLQKEPTLWVLLLCGNHVALNFCFTKDLFQEGLL